MADQFRKTRQQAAEPDEVSCGFCSSFLKLKAVKTCLVCQISYCETHLEPHHRVTVFKQHKLIDPVKNLEDFMCPRHERPLELFCKTDHMCVCRFCTESDHRSHHTVSLEEECEEMKAELRKTEAEVQQMIQERQMKIQEVRHSVELSQKDTDRAIADSVQNFTALPVRMAVVQLEKTFRQEMEKLCSYDAELRSTPLIISPGIPAIQEVKHSVELKQKDTDKGITDTCVQIFIALRSSVEKQKTTEKQAEGFIKALQQEITWLEKRSSELKQLSHTEDHLHLLHNFPSINTPPPTKDWTKVNVFTSSYVGTVRIDVAQLEKTLSQVIEKLCDVDMILRRVRQYAVDVTLDPDTAEPYLILSEDGKQVNAANNLQNKTKKNKKKKMKNIPDTERFYPCSCVLGKQSFSSGRFYYEVQVKGKTDWDLGVARESINRKGPIKPTPNNGYWIIVLRNGNEYWAAADPAVLLPVRKKVQKVGVFVDYEEGLVSFYDVEARVHRYLVSFTGCTFTEKLYPYFSPCTNNGGKNSAPLIISP